MGFLVAEMNVSPAWRLEGAERKGGWGAPLEFAKACKKGEPCGHQKLKEKGSALPKIL